jgi:hypothetical protein
VEQKQTCHPQDNPPQKRMKRNSIRLIFQLISAYLIQSRQVWIAVAQRATFGLPGGRISVRLTSTKKTGTP